MKFLFWKKSPSQQTDKTNEFFDLQSYIESEDFEKELEPWRRAVRSKLLDNEQTECQCRNIPVQYISHIKNELTSNGYKCTIENETVFYFQSRKVLVIEVNNV